jgi:hypothetical protein
VEIITEFSQNTDEWMHARIGSIGGSSIQSVCAKGSGKMRSNLLYRMAGEIFSGIPYEGYYNDDMQRGHILESKARIEYEVITGYEVKQVAMMKATDKKHCSPDGDVEKEKGIIEIKCRIPSVHIETIDKNKVNASDRKQCQWNLFISEREWLDYLSYCPLIPTCSLFVVRVKRDEKLIKEMDAEADRFLEDLDNLVERIKKR